MQDLKATNINTLEERIRLKKWLTMRLQGSGEIEIAQSLDLRLATFQVKRVANLFAEELKTCAYTEDYGTFVRTALDFLADAMVVQML